MKYMNNHYGMSRVFGKARCKMPMNLQYFAEGGEGDAGAEGGAEKLVEHQKEPEMPEITRDDQGAEDHL